MKAKLKANLDMVMDKWMTDHCESDGWPSVWVGDHSAELMADAAAAVFDAICDAETYCEREGVFETS